MFLKDFAVPVHNNSSERAIGNIKVKQKVSSQFKADNATMYFAKIVSTINTTVKNSKNALIALKLIVRNGFSLEQV